MKFLMQLDQRDLLFLFKDSGAVLGMELTKFLESIWEREKIPKDWHESPIAPIYQ